MGRGGRPVLAPSLRAFQLPLLWAGTVLSGDLLVLLLRETVWTAVSHWS